MRVLSKKKIIAIFTYNQWLFSLDMKTKVVQHVESEWMRERESVRVRECESERVTFEPRHENKSCSACLLSIGSEWENARVRECESVKMREWLLIIYMKTKVVQHVENKWIREWKSESVRVWECESVRVREWESVLVPSFCLTFRKFFIGLWLRDRLARNLLGENGSFYFGIFAQTLNSSYILPSRPLKKSFVSPSTFLGLKCATKTAWFAT